MCTHWEGCQRAFGKRCLKLLPYILITIHYCLIQTNTQTHTYTHSNTFLFSAQVSCYRHPPLSPMPQCLPITKEVINSTTAPSREIDFNDTSYMAAVSVPDSHLHTSRDLSCQLSAALHCKTKQYKPKLPTRQRFIQYST